MLGAQEADSKSSPQAADPTASRRESTASLGIGISSGLHRRHFIGTLASLGDADLQPYLTRQGPHLVVIQGIVVCSVPDGPARYRTWVDDGTGIAVVPYEARSIDFAENLAASPAGSAEPAKGSYVKVIGYLARVLLAVPATPSSSSAAAARASGKSKRPVVEGAGVEVLCIRLVVLGQDPDAPALWAASAMAAERAVLPLSAPFSDDLGSGAPGEWAGEGAGDEWREDLGGRAAGQVVDAPRNLHRAPP